MSKKYKWGDDFPKTRKEVDRLLKLKKGGETNKNVSDMAFLLWDFRLKEEAAVSRCRDPTRDYKPILNLLKTLEIRLDCILDGEDVRSYLKRYFEKNRADREWKHKIYSNE